jgi:ABC-type branched-subunit amino acid transport system substrate-binding protein
MKICTLFLILIMFFGLLSCAPIPPGPPGKIELDEELQLFSKAENLYRAGSYDQALKLYNTYLSKFSDRPLAPAALMKIGKIHSKQEKFEASRVMFQRVLDEYPQSSFVTGAKIEIMSSYHREGRHDIVIERASELMKEDIPESDLIRILVLLGDAYLAKGAFSESLHSYSTAWARSAGPAKEQIFEKLKIALRQIDPKHIHAFLNTLNDKPPAGYLMLELGLMYFAEKKYHAAEETLSTFVKRFPLHEGRHQAKGLLDELQEKLILREKTIGCLLPLTGPYQTFGNRALKGIELALNRFSSQNGSPWIKLIIKDTGSDPDLTTPAVKELCAKNVAAIVGPIITAEFAAIEAQDNGIPIVTLTQRDRITEIGDYVFRNFITPRMQVEAIVSYVSRELGLRRFAILYPDEKYGSLLMNLFWDEVLGHGGKIVGLESYNPAHTDFADPIKKLVGLYYEIPKDLKDKRLALGDGTNPHRGITIKAVGKEKGEPEPIIDFEAVFIPDAPAKAGLIIPQLAFSDIEDVYLLGTNLWHSKQLIRMAGRYLRGALIPTGFFIDSASKPVRDFVKDFRRTFDEDPGFMEAIAYDTAVILLEILSRPEIRFRNDLKHQLSKLIDFNGITGKTSFSDSGEAQKKLYLLRVKGDRFLELK